MIQEWQIKSRNDGCDGCQVGFVDQQAYYTVLRFGEKGYTRRDLCESCREKADDDAQVISSWKGIYRVSRPPRKSTRLTTDAMEQLLREHMEIEEEANTSMIYLLAVMLERKRVLIEREVNRDDARKVRVYEHRQSGETFLVRDPELRLDELEDVRREVLATLRGEALSEGEDAEETSPGTDGCDDDADAQTEGAGASS
tara:strand:+ start:327 stop:923 length:597 start_codon:yes stop_codon:yes gene_type:complete